MKIVPGNAYEPDLKDVVLVDQRSFGYLRPDSDKKFIETKYLMSCIGLYMRAKDGTSVVAHIDGGPRGALSNDQVIQTRELLGRLEADGFAGKLEGVYMVKTHLVPKDAFREVGNALKEATGMDPVVVDSDDMTAHFAVDKEGGFNWLYNHSVRYDDTPYSQIKRLNEDPSLVCVNDLAGK
jgi:hypothetical protein